MHGIARVLGVDTSLRSTGVAVVDASGNRITAVEYGAIRPPRNASHSECLISIFRGISEAIERFQPEAAAMEGIFFCRNVATAVVLGEARGAVMCACADRGVPLYEYAPRRVKQAVVGYGGADKSQVRRMIVSMLGLEREPQEDAGDALAIAICHVHCRTGLADLMPDPI
jgi:crossover junction endodeoxyribonuclease RuvC